MRNQVLQNVTARSFSVSANDYESNVLGVRSFRVAQGSILPPPCCPCDLISLANGIRDRGDTHGGRVRSETSSLDCPVQVFNKFTITHIKIIGP